MFVFNQSFPALAPAASPSSRISRASTLLAADFRRNRSSSAPRSVRSGPRAPEATTLATTPPNTRIRWQIAPARVRQNDIGAGRSSSPPHDPQNSNARPTAAPARCGQCHSDGHPGRQSEPVPGRRTPYRSHAGRGPPVSGRAATALRTSVTILPERTSFEVKRTTA